jgi:hypothetical protein
MMMMMVTLIFGDVKALYCSDLVLALLLRMTNS